MITKEIFLQVQQKWRGAIVSIVKRNLSAIFYFF